MREQTAALQALEAAVEPLRLEADRLEQVQLARCRDQTAMDTLDLRAAGGDLPAIECAIARADFSLATLRYGHALLELELDETVFNQADGVAWRYMRWIMTGEEPDDIIALSRELTRTQLMNAVRAAYSEHLLASTGDYGFRSHWASDGCFRRPPKMDRLWRAAQPDAGSARCDAAVGGNPDH